MVDGPRVPPQAHLRCEELLRTGEAHVVDGFVWARTRVFIG
jgi:hypothetical protein